MLNRIVPGMMLALLLTSMLMFTSNAELVAVESPRDDEVDVDSSLVYEAGVRPRSLVLNECERDDGSCSPHLKSENSIEVNTEQGYVEETDSVRKLSWHSADGTSPTLFNETFVIQKPFELQLVNRIEAPVTDGIYVLVNDSLYSEVQSRLNQYVLDVLDAGYWVDVYTIQGGTPEDVRGFLQGGLSEGLVGCLFVGDVPEPWYEIYGCWDEYNEEFPIDLFYMDLDGLWTDFDGDGIYDAHNGNVAPEIWVGRLKASNIEGAEASLINNYFEKNHLYRIGRGVVPQRALIYIDDDWTHMADSVNSSLGEVYSGATDVIVDGATTTAEDYKSRIAEGYEWVHLQCHGWSGGHSFKIGEEWTGGTVYSSDYRSIDPPVFFYQLFVCSGARYVEPDYLAGSCIFTDEYGLLAIGSTKTGSMLYFSDFYGNLGEDDCVGEAFRRWFVEYGEGNPCWFYGLSIIGDPTLIPMRGPLYTVDSNPQARIVEVDGEPYVTPVSFYWMEGSNHSVNVSSPQYESSDVRYVFENWSDGGAQSHVVTVGVSDRNITVRFDAQYYLSVTTSPTELTPQPIVTPLGLWHANGATVNCMAQKTSGYTFDHWMVDEANQGHGVNPIEITMNESHTAIAHYLLLVRVIPGVIEFGPEDVVGQNFTVACVIENVTDLAGLDIRVSWNTTFLEYVGHVATIPVEDYPSPIPPSPYPGIIHEPELEVKDLIDELAGTYWSSFATLGGSSFNGSGTVFVMTFQVIDEPSPGGDDVNVSIHFTSTNLVRSSEAGGGAIPHAVVDGTIIIHAYKVHDIAVTDLTSSKTVVARNYTALISITIENQGGYTEVFNVTAYANATIIGMHLVALPSGNSTTVTFTWNTTDWIKGNYTMSAYAEPVLGENDTRDNSLTDGWIVVTIPGDVDGDFDVDIYDVVRLCKAYGSECGDLKCDANCDIDGDGDIDIYDVVIVCNHYGETYP